MPLHMLSQAPVCSFDWWFWINLSEVVLSTTFSFDCSTTENGEVYCNLYMGAELVYLDGTWNVERREKKTFMKYLSVLSSSFFTLLEVWSKIVSNKKIILELKGCFISFIANRLCFTNAVCPWCCLMYTEDLECRTKTTLHTYYKISHRRSNQ